MANRWGNSGKSGWLCFGGSKITADGDCSHEIKRRLLLGRKVMTNLETILKSRVIPLLTKVLGRMVVPVVVQMEELDYKEGWVQKNWCFWTVVLEKTLESPFDCKGIKPVTLKGNQRQILIGMTEVEVPIFYPPVLKIRLIGKVPDAGIDWRQKEKRAAKDEVVRGS